ncbi:glycosyltransferase family protein [Acinetobacter rathckeae]|uniref:acyl esterase n=1 Tax=Acinetobacter rathckeae TaxID=2605272 RepID=UPI0018A2869A|nr:acyl esterase [Acinetobacter rathckeae]MBF7688992.1 acyl esterase [Acinetobacter rathckeae]
MKDITTLNQSTKLFCFCTLVTRFDEYQEMVESAKQAGFTDAEFYYFDNKNNNSFDGFSGINYAINQCTAKYLIFCHQDILFNFDRKDHLLNKIAELDKVDPNWAVIGNAGRTAKGKLIARITDPHADNQSYGPFPSEVMSVDENFMIINMKHNLSCSTQMKGFHLYGLDLCQNAQFLGLKSYVIDFHLLHKSKGNIDQNFLAAKAEYIKLQQQRKSWQVYFTTCTCFYVSSLKFLNRFFARKTFFRWLCSWVKRVV